MEIEVIQKKMIEIDETIDKLRQGNKKEAYMTWLTLVNLEEQNKKIIELLEDIKKNTTPKVEDIKILKVEDTKITKSK